jgi:hypothetical protein
MGRAEEQGRDPTARGVAMSGSQIGVGAGGEEGQRTGPPLSPSKVRLSYLHVPLLVSTASFWRSHHHMQVGGRERGERLPDHVYPYQKGAWVRNETVTCKRRDGLRVTFKWLLDFKMDFRDDGRRQMHLPSSDGELDLGVGRASGEWDGRQFWAHFFMQLWYAFILTTQVTLDIHNLTFV